MEHPDTSDPASVELPVADELPPDPAHRTFPLVVLEELPPDEPLSIDDDPAHPATATVRLAPPTPLASGSDTADSPHPNPVRLLGTLAVGFLALFLVLRTTVVEPFGVPTGSMAPTLLGNHREANCPRCGYPLRVGSPSAAGWADMMCPNCQQRVNMATAAEVSGDRLLVDKNVYGLRKPRRWEVAVFRCPDPKDPLKPYVKRIVGLPGELIRIVDGDVEANGELQRKTLAQVRETHIPVFDMTYSPAHIGWGSRWLVARRDSITPPTTADATVVSNGVLVLAAATSPQTEFRLQYRHWSLDDETEHPITAWNSYDGPARGAGPPDPAHDFMLSCTVEVTFGTGHFSCDLFDGADTVGAEIPVGPTDAGSVVLVNRAGGRLGSSAGVTLVPGKSYRVEFAFVDRRVSLAIDGKEVLPAADVPKAAHLRGPVNRPIHLAARGCRVVVRDLKLYRDIHYTQYGENGTKYAARLGPTEYFMLGDNSGNSEDSRKWPRPGVPENDFIGKPFLIHQPLRLGRVTLGGRERVFQTLDWSRLRWVR